MGYPKQNIKWVAKVPSKKKKLEGKSWAPHPPRSSPLGPPPPRLEPRAGGLGILTQTPLRARLPREGLGRERRLRLARGSSRKASAGSAFSVSREASARSLISVSREASFSVSLEAGSSVARRAPPRPTLPTARHVSLILQPLCGGINPYTLTAKLGLARIDGFGPPER